MKAAMSRRERVLAAFVGDPVDRPPVTFWQHAPGRDLRASDFVPLVLAFQARYDLDIVKITPSASYPVLDYGVTIRPANDDIGTTRVVSTPIQSPDDWLTLSAATTPAIDEQVETVRQVRAAMGPDIPIVQTLFSPLTVAARLAGGSFPTGWLEGSAAERLIEGLRILGDAAIAMGQRMIAAGADGFFVSSQYANTALPAGVYERLGVPDDSRVLAALRPAWLLLHLHGDGPIFDLADRYSVDAVSWHAGETPPDLADPPTTRARMAGIPRQGVIVDGSPDDVTAAVRAAIAATGGRRHIVAPGCTIPLTAPAATLRAARAAVESRSDA